MQAVIPHPYGTNSDSRAHPILHLIACTSEEKNRLLKKAELSEAFYQGDEVEAANYAESLDFPAVLEKAEGLSELAEKMTNARIEKILAFTAFRLKAGKKINFIVDQKDEQEVFQTLAEAEEIQEAIGLNVEAWDLRLGVNSVLKSREWTAEDVVLENVWDWNEDQEVNIDEMIQSGTESQEIRRKMIKAYLSFSESEQAEEYWREQQKKIWANMLEGKMIHYECEEIILFLMLHSEYSPGEKTRRLNEKLSKKALFDEEYLLGILNEIPKCYKKRKLVHMMKSYLNNWR